jgi:hypothetical protein
MQAKGETDMRTLGLLAGAALALAACAGSREEPLTISEIQVETDLAAVGSREAVAYWQSLSGDLETALANQFLGRIDPSGNRITVDVDEISLTSPFASGATAETARLSGRVEMLNPAGTSEGVWDVTATAQDVADFLPAGTDVVRVQPTTPEYYNAVVQAFARGAALTIDANT